MVLIRFLKYKALLKALLAMGVLIATSQTVFAAWTFVYNGTMDAKIYYEPTTSSRDGEKVRVWVMIDMPYKQTDGSLSLREYWEMNCKEISYRILQQEKYPEHQNNGLRISGDTDAGDWRYIGPDGVDRMILGKVCS